MPFATTVAEGDDPKVQQDTNPDRVSNPMCYAGSQYDINTGIAHLLSWRAMTERDPNHRRNIIARGDAVFLQKYPSGETPDTAGQLRHWRPRTFMIEDYEFLKYRMNCHTMTLPRVKNCDGHFANEHQIVDRTSVPCLTILSWFLPYSFKPQGP